MRNIIIGLVWAVLVLSPSLAAAELVDRVVAVVNDDLITLSDLNKEGKGFFEKIKQRAPALELERAMQNARREVLASLIDKMIATQKAAELGISVSDQEVDNAIEGILARNNTTMEGFMDELVAMGETEESYRRMILIQILQSKLVNYEVHSKIVITEDRIKDYYKSKYSGKEGKSGYHILQMGFSWPGRTFLLAGGDINEKKAKEEAGLRAEKTREMILSGEDFRELAREHSDLPSAVDGGDIGLFEEDEMAPYMRKTILALKPGQISPIVETSSGYQFFKLLATREEDTSFEAVKEEIREQLYREEIERKYEVWVKDLKEQAYIKELL